MNSLTPLGVPPLHRARALPTIILPSSCGNIYPFSSSLRPRDSSGDNPFPRFFLVCSLQISVALHDIALSKAFFLYSLLSALQKAFITLLLPSSSAVVGCVLLSRFAVVCLSQIFYIHCHQITLLTRDLHLFKLIAYHLRSATNSLHTPQPGAIALFISRRGV